MALNHLTIPEMVTSTETWVEPGHAVHEAFMSVPSLAGLMPRITSAHDGLLSVQRVSLDQFLARLTELRTLADWRHDGHARVSKYMLDAHIIMARLGGDIATAEMLEKVRDELFPNDLEVVNLSYIEEAGQARLLLSRMTVSTEQALAGIPMKTGTLLDVVRAWLAAGVELGRLEGEVADIQQPSRRGPVAAVRKAWMRMVNAVRTVYELETPNEVIDGALHKITMAEKAALERILAGARRADEDGDNPTDTDADTGADADPAPAPAPAADPAPAPATP